MKSQKMEKVEKVLRNENMNGEKITCCVWVDDMKQRKTFRSFIFMDVFNLMCVPSSHCKFYILYFSMHTLVPQFLTIVSPILYKNIEIFTSKWYTTKMNIARWAPSVHHMCVLNFISLLFCIYIFLLNIKHKRGPRFCKDFIF